MTTWDIYESRLLKPGKQQRDRILGREIDAIRRKYMASPSLKVIVVENRNRKQSVLIHSTDIPSEKTFNTLPGETMSIGDIIEWNGMHWLVTQIDFDDEITRSGRIVQCNRKIRWQNKNTGAIVERWCLATKPYSSNIAEGLAIATSNREFKIQVTYDDETMMIDLDRRFLLEKINGTPKAYQVTSVDTITNRYEESDGGFLVWNMKQCEYNSVTDNADMMIADYCGLCVMPDDDEDTGETEDLLRCEIDGSDIVRCGRSRTYTPVFFDGDGVRDDAIMPAWSLSGDIDMLETSVDGRILTVTVVDDDRADGNVFTIDLCDTGGKYKPATKKVEVAALL